MSDKFRITLVHETLRGIAHRAVDKCPLGYVIEMRPATRTDDQNARFHAAVRCIAKAFPEFGGVPLDEEDWKRLLIAMVYGQKVVPNPSGSGLVVLNKKTSQMTRPEMSDLTEAVYAFGTERGVEFPEPPSDAK